MWLLHRQYSKSDSVGLTYIAGSFANNSGDRGDALHWKFLYRVRSWVAVGPVLSFGSMNQEPEILTNQCVRAWGGSPHNARVPTLPHVFSTAADMWQFHCNVTYKQGRQGQIMQVNTICDLASQTMQPEGD